MCGLSFSRRKCALPLFRVLKTLNNSRFSCSSFVFEQNFSKKELPFDSFFQPIKMAKKTTTKGGAGFGGTQNDDESSVKETINENFSFDVGTPVWVKDANHAWVAASISKVGSGDLSSGEGTSSLFFECTFAEDEDDGREEKKKNNSNGGNGGGGKGGGKGGDLSLASAQPTTIVIAKENEEAQKVKAVVSVEEAEASE